MCRKSNGSWKGEQELNGNIYAALYDHYTRDGAPGKDGQDGKPGADGKPGQDGEDGRGIKSVNKEFAVNNDPVNNPTSG